LIYKKDKFNFNEFYKLNFEISQSLILFPKNEMLITSSLIVEVYKMKVLSVNGSPNKKRCTYTALCEVEKELNKFNIETEIFYIGKKP